MDVPAVLARYPERFDVVMGADVVHWPTAVLPLVHTIEALLKPGADAVAVIAYVERGCACWAVQPVLSRFPTLTHAYDSARTARSFLDALEASRLRTEFATLPVQVDECVLAAGTPRIALIRWKDST